MQLFYNANIAENDTELSFHKEESKHITKVLRKQNGDIIHITNGKGWLFKAELTHTDIKHCTVRIIEKTKQQKHNYKLHLAVAPTKMNDRYEWFLEKVTELGIDTITPIICDNSERKIIKPERFKRIILSAVKQSLQCYLPELNAPVDFKTFIAQQDAQQKFIAHCDDTSKRSLKSQLQPNQDYLILIGPEGDFSSNEITLALQHKFIPVTLGDTRLRTETAALAAVHSVVFTNND